MKRKTHSKIQPFAILLFLFTASFLSSCGNDDPKPDDPPVNETELITTVILEFKDSMTAAKSHFVFSDPDGEGGNDPVRHDTITLASNSAYFMNIILLDESKSPADTISNEVLEEADDHLFVFIPAVSGWTVRYLDADSNGFPIGLKTFWKTGNAAQGSVNIRLKHQPGVKDGSSGPGETDMEIDFQARAE